MCVLGLLLSCADTVKKSAREPAWSSPSEVTSILKQQFARWEGTPYRYGGDSRRGVDCSAFVQSVYRDGFGFGLPRSTTEQMREGTPITRNSLEVGDLVFFQISPKQPHVGIYIGDDRFIHASTTAGVSMSSLTEAYWRPKYVTAKRVLPFMR